MSDTNENPVETQVATTEQDMTTHTEADEAGTTELQLGQMMRDVISGFEGIAIQKVEKYNGNIMYALQPKAKSGEDGHPDAMVLDELMLDYVHDGVVERVTPVQREYDIVLGDMVEDIATGFKGIALEKVTFLNGCVFYAVLPKAVKTDILNNNSHASMIDAGRLEVCRKGGIAHLLPEPAILASGKSPGGPSHRLSFRG
jgi:hypothetical protein